MEIQCAMVMRLEPKNFIRRWNRCKWILAVSLVLTAITLATLIPGIVGLAEGNQYKDTLIYLGIMAAIFAGLFFTFWYICQIETGDVEVFDRDIHQRSTKRHDDHVHHRPKSLRSPLTSESREEKYREMQMERQILV